MSGEASQHEKKRFVALVDALPLEESAVVTALYWEQLSLRDVAKHLGWVMSTGEGDAMKVERVFARAKERLEKLAELVELDFVVMYGR